MKLRNKKTGEVIESKELLTDEFIIDLFSTDYDSFCTKLHKIIEEWEDYEEPKDDDYWYIDDLGRIQFSSVLLDEIYGGPNNWMIRKHLGNYFGSREEAEQAVRKLKAWILVKDKGLTFCGWKITDDGCSVDVETTLDAEIVRAQQRYITDDLNLLFGGEE